MYVYIPIYTHVYTYIYTNDGKRGIILGLKRRKNFFNINGEIEMMETTRDPELVESRPEHFEGRDTGETVSVFEHFTEFYYRRVENGKGTSLEDRWKDGLLS